MRKILLLLVLCAALFSCQKDQYVLHGTIKGIADGKKVTLEKQQESIGIIIPVDSAKVENGKFTFEGKALEPSIYLIAVEGVQAKSFVILENGEINIDINKDSVFENKLSGTYNNDQLMEFNKAGANIQKKIQKFKTANQMKMQEAMKTKDTATIGALRTQFKALSEEMAANTIKYIESHPKAFISALLIENMFGAPNADTKKLETYYKNLDPELKKTKVGKSIDKKLAELKSVAVGRKAPNFSAPDVNGKNVSLSESIGRVTIIDFWASWCGPCRAESPNMVALYNEYHAKGLNIIGVSLDKTADDWKAAIAKDKLDWTQISNLKYWDDPIAAQYGVKAIPATFVLNQYGVVVAKDLKGEALKAKIAEMMTDKKPALK
jgi:peroxiredoxin